VNISGFPTVALHFKRMQERPSVKKLLAYEKELNDGFAKTAQATIAFSQTHTVTDKLKYLAVPCGEIESQRRRTPSRWV